MAEPSFPDHPTIPPGRAKAFHDAVWFYAEWWGESEPHVLPQSSPASRATAGALGFLAFNQSSVRPER
jgi:hypothetical protein